MSQSMKRCEVKVKVQGQNRRTELPLAIDIFTKFGNPTKVLSARNMPFDNIQDGGLRRFALSECCLLVIIITD